MINDSCYRRTGEDSKRSLKGENRAGQEECHGVRYDNGPIPKRHSVEKPESGTRRENGQHAKSDTSPADFVVQGFRSCGQKAQVVSPLPRTRADRDQS